MLTKLKEKLSNDMGKTAQMNISDIGPIGMALVGAIVTISIGAMILAEIKGQQEANTTAQNVTESGIEGLSVFGDWWSIIAIVVVAAIVLSILYMLRGRGR